MKRTLSILLTSLALWLLGGSACAQTALPDALVSLLLSAWPGHTITASDQCGKTAAAVLSSDAGHVLCIAEEQNGAWKLAVSNPAALRQDTAVTGLLLDTDETLFWSYHLYDSVYESCHAARQDGQWRLLSLTTSETHDNGNINEYHLWHADGRLQYSAYLCDENENILSVSEYAPVPARWLDGLMPLSAYDDSVFPKPDCFYTHSWLSREATAQAAAELFPGDEFLGGCAKRNHVEFFLQKPNGDRVIAVCRFDERDGWNIIQSTPLPQGTTYGLENFSSSLVIGDLLVNIGPVDDNTCGVTYIYNTTDGGMFTLGKNWVTDEAPNGYENCFGDHPWSDVSLIDWSCLPRSQQEALSRLDTTGWAVVNNPNPADRLHLRTRPQRGAKSLGKYYNGTPVRILERKGDWVRVSIFGVEGWMMKEYLAFGADGHEVEAAFPARMPVEDQTSHPVFAQPETGHPIADAQDALLVLAVVGDEWYHAWFPQDNQTGYVLQSDWWEGNG